MVAQQEVGEGCGGGFEVKAAGAYSRRGMRCGPHRATCLNFFRIGLRSISVGLRLDSSRAGFGSAILQPRKARIYTEALARILFRVILCVPWLKGFWELRLKMRWGQN
jgi:hypothetical protein